MADNNLVIEPISVTSPRLPDDGSLDDNGNPVVIPQAKPTAIVGEGVVPTGNSGYSEDASSDYLKLQTPLSGEAYDQQIKDIQAGKVLVPNTKPPLDLSEEPTPEVEGIGGYAADMARGAAVGVVNAGTEINHTLANVADFLAPDAWTKDPEYFTKLAEEYSPRIDDKTFASVGLKVPATVAGELTKGIAQFMVGFVPALKAVRGIQAIGSVSKGAMTAKTAVGMGTAGGVADLSVFNPYEKRLSNMAKDSGIPGFDNAITEYFAASKDDPELLARVKQAGEGYVVGKVLEPLVALIGATRKAKAVYAEEHGMVPPSQTVAAYMTDPATGAKVDVTDRIGKDLESPRFTLKEPSVIVPDEAVQQDFANAYLDGNYEGAAEKASGLVNLKYLNTEEGIRDMIEGFAQVKSQAIEKYTRGWTQAARNAGRLGADAIPEAAARVHSLDSFVIKAEETRAAVAYKVKELANIAKAAPSEVTMAEFKDAFKKLHVIDAMVTGNKAEIARAMKAMQRPVTGADMANSIASKTKGMVGLSGQSEWDKLAEMVSNIPDSAGITRLAKAATMPNWKDALTEVYINALFSPPTFIVNSLANGLSLGGSVVERYAGALGSTLKGSGELTLREANNYALGLVKGVAEGVQAFSQAWKTNAPVMGHDASKFIESNHNISFTGASFGIKDGDGWLMDKMGKGVDLVGVGLRSMPGGTRSLMATDEFFKAIFYRCELAALAQREAQKIGLKAGTPEYLAKIREIELGASTAKVGEPYHGIKLASEESAARSTFTESFGEGAEKLLEGLRHFRSSYIVLPFVKTPVNLLKYMTRRTPGLAGQSDYMIGELSAGGARADLAEAQLALGTMYLTTGLALASGGYLQGQITSNFTAQRNLTQLGVEQQSYINPETGEQTALGRLDGNPISFLLFAATVHETASAFIDANAEEMTDSELEDGLMHILSIPVAVASKYALNKSWTQGMAQLLDGIKNETMDTYLQKTMGNLLPAGNTIKWVNKQSVDPFMREADSALDEIRSKIPGLSRTLPPVPDLLGNPSKSKQLDGFGTNPVTQKIPDSHPVMAELRRLQLATPDEVILGGVTRQLEGVKLDGVEKWNFMQFVRQIKDGDGKDLVDTLEEVMASKEYQDPTLTDEQRNNKLSDLYEKRKALAKKALQYDSLMFSRGEPRPYAEEYDLYDYKRITPLATKVGTKAFSKAQALFGNVGKTREQFIDERNDEIVKSNLGIELQ